VTVATCEVTVVRNVYVYYCHYIIITTITTTAAATVTAAVIINTDVWSFAFVSIFQLVQTICFFPNSLPFPSESVPENVDFVNVSYGHATVSVIILFHLSDI